ncbi:gliding motility-associated C-terminal domain-containing protein [Chondrinema litorale]|uniref:T9SS type B sorting domain-containing protein n=1 Tax=Chondrinema litorale TaxID=2994555 RepID=UPI002543594A|nr:gliding motility-associated C-terminal domain-containing protein [Chondrinema litorale]UZR92593.1 gliding motility-associated C-terminal domain-containing protein [Chondrinema litorale]
MIYKYLQPILIRDYMQRVKGAYFFLFFITAFYLQLSTAYSQDCTNKTDYDILVEIAARFAEKTGDIYEFPNGQQWDLNAARSTWKGVTLDATDATIVTELQLNNFGIEGKIPVNIGCLTNLQTLNLSGNSFNGSIPTEIGNLTNLYTLNLSDNQLSGSIPEEIFTKLTSLTSLNLSNNHKDDESGLSGSIPSVEYKTLFLSELNLNTNKITGSIPASFEQLDNLVNVYIINNEISDISQIDFSAMNSLKDFYLSNNLITDLPENLSFPTSLQKLYLSNNKLTFKDFIHPTNANLQVITDVATNVFYPQLLVGEERTVIVNEGETALLDFEVDEELTDVDYVWYKDNVESHTSKVSAFEIPTVQLTDAGEYYFTSTHNSVSDLELQSEKITLKVLGACADEDKNALSKIYDATNGAAWETPWDMNGDVADFDGVTVDQTTGCVTGLELIAQNLHGELPIEINEIANLKSLVIESSENLNGELPLVINSIIEDIKVTGTSIETVDLQVQDATNILQVLDLSNNALEELPDISTLSLPNISEIKVEGNQLTFEDILPYKDIITSYSPQDSIGNTDNPVILIGGDYTYQLPFFDQSLPTESKFVWYKNGQVFSEDSRDLVLTKLAQEDEGEYYCEITNADVSDLTLYSRKITLSVKDDCSTADYEALKAIYDATDGLNWTWNDVNNAWDFSNDAASTDMSTWEGLIFNTDGYGCLTGLVLQNKGMNGILPSDIGSLINLDSLVITGNIALTGSIPSEISLIENLIHLDLSQNSLSGNIPSGVGELTQLEKLLLGYNALSGEIPQTISQLEFLHKLDLSNNTSDGNGLSGNIPDELFELTYLDTLNLSVNKFSGQLSEMFSQLNALKYLDLSNNQLDGELPSGLFDVATLEGLNLHSNNFTGAIPGQLTQLINLQELRLNANELEGDLPVGISNMPLTWLLLNENKLTGLGDAANISGTPFINVADNALTFEDLLPFTNPPLDYEPQDSVGVKQVQLLTVGQTYTFDLDIDDGISTNIYSWKKDGSIIDQTSENIYVIENVTEDDAGVYTCEVTNSYVVGLTLYSREFILETEGSSGSELSIEGDTVVCPGPSSSYSYTVLNSSGDITWSLDPQNGGNLSNTSSETIDLTIYGEGTYELQVTDAVSGETASITIKGQSTFDSPTVEYQSVIIVGQPFEDIVAVGVSNAEFKWYFNGEEIATGEVFNPGDIANNGFSNTDAGYYDFEVVQTSPGGLCQSNATQFRLRIVEVTLDAPENLVAEYQEEDGTVLLTWEYSSQVIVDNVIIERSVNGTDNFEQIAVVEYDGTNTYVDSSDLEENTEYYYRIRLANFNDNVASEYSNIAGVSTDGSIEVNTPPYLTNISLTGEMNKELVISSEEFIDAFFDSDGDTLVSVIITTLPENGTLYLGDIELTRQEIISVSALENLVFIPDEDWTGETSFTYSASDGKDQALESAIVNITITENAVTDPIDLIISGAVEPNNITIGTDVTFDIIVENTGEATAGSFNVQVYFSSDSLLSNDDLAALNIRVDSLAAGEVYELSQVLTIPDGFPEGDYLVLLYVDSNLEVDEEDEENNLVVLGITISEIIPDPVVPNIITPNGDGYNDYLLIENLEYYPENRLQVLDKWGKEIFVVENYQNDWAGTDSNGMALPAGNYMCVFTVVDVDTKTFTEVLTIIK